MLLSLRFILRHTVLKYMIVVVCAPEQPTICVIGAPSRKKVSHAFEHLVQNLKVYNGVEI